MDDDIQSYYEKIIQEILKWMDSPPNVLSVTLGKAAYPLTWLVQQMIPDRAIEGALSAFDWAGKKSVTAPGTTNGDLRARDGYADQVINFHIGIATAEGGAAGFFGLPALVVDVPALVLLALRMVRQIGCEYGYDADTEEERQFVLSTVSAASANSQAEKITAMTINAYLINLISKTTWKAMGAKATASAVSGEAAVIATKQLAKQLGINITKRSALAAIPVIGAGVGAGFNGWFVREVGTTAQNLYRRRWLNDRGLWIEAPKLKEPDSRSL